MRRHEGTDELTAFLNARDQDRSRRRKPHHLEQGVYLQTQPCFCVTLCARRHRLPFLNEWLAELVTGAISHYQRRRHWSVYAYCLMPDHLHLIVRLLPSAGSPNAVEPDSDEQAELGLKEIIARLKSYTTSQGAWKVGLQGSLWQRDLYDHVGRSYEDFTAQCRYVLNNPVRAGLVEDWEEYPWSGILDEWRF